MSATWSDIKQALQAGRWIISHHAAMRLRQRRVRAWQVVSAVDSARMLRVREDAEPNPVAEISVILPDGKSCVCVWAWLEADSSALLVTVYFDDRS